MDAINPQEDTMNSTNTPREIDEALAAVHNEIYRLEDRLALVRSSFFSMAKAKYYYRGRKRVTDMNLDDARAIVTRDLEVMEAHEEAHGDEDGLWIGWSSTTIAPYEMRSARDTVRKEEEILFDLDQKYGKANDLEALYTGWSRFFLVTSSDGHIHSSMHCSSCRPTTRYGWMPQLSGKSEDEAVKELGPTLCSRCFDSAPTEWTTGKKITAAQAAKKVA